MLVDDLGEKMVKRVKRALINAGIKKFSRIYNSVYYRIENDELVLVINHYYEEIQKGRPAGAPLIPVNAIKDWMRRYRIKKIEPYAIVYSIRKKGTKPRPFMKEALTKFYKDMDKMVDEYINWSIQTRIERIT